MNVIDQILKEKQIAYAVFDHEFLLVEKSTNLRIILNDGSVENQSSLFDIFPEFFGSENKLTKIQNGENKKYSLEKINRLNSNSEIIYFDFTVLPFNPKLKQIVLIISNTTKESELLQKVNQQKNEISILKESLISDKNDAFKKISGQSDVINSIKKFIKKVAPISDSTILLTGESGTGKTLIARAIHSLSKNVNGNFIEVNCATIPEALIESEIFGHVKGAFTNAIENKRGLIEEAEDGTLFLDEIGELPISLQPKLLTFLETKRFRQVGSTKEINVNTRIITATNKDLLKAIADKEFREDLYYRINVVSLKIPSLKDRREDIISLAEDFANIFSVEIHKRICILSKEAQEKLINYNWPGNIRELKNIIERAIIFNEDGLIKPEDLSIGDSGKILSFETEAQIPQTGILLEEIEKKYLKSALQKANGNQTKAAKLLGLSLDTFRYRIKKFEIE